MQVGSVLNGHCEIWRSPNVGTGGSLTVTITYASSNVAQATFSEVNGLGTVLALDQTSGQTNTGATATAGAVNTTIAAEIAFSAVSVAVAGGIAITYPAGYTGIDKQAGKGGSAYLVYATVQTGLNPSWAITAGVYACALATYSASQGGGGSVPDFEYVEYESIVPRQPPRRQNLLFAAVQTSNDMQPFAFISDRTTMMAAVNPQQDRAGVRPSLIRTGETVSPVNVPFADLLTTLAPVWVQSVDPIPRRRVPVPDHQLVDVVAEWWLIPLRIGAMPEAPPRRRTQPPFEQESRPLPPPLDDRALSGWRGDSDGVYPRRLPRWQPTGENTFFLDVTTVPQDATPQVPRRTTRPVPLVHQDLGWFIGSDYKITVDVQTAEPRQQRRPPFPAGEGSWCPPAVQIDPGASRIVDAQPPSPQPRKRQPLASLPTGELLGFWSDTTYGAVPDGDDAGMSQYPRRLTRPVWLAQPHDIVSGAAAPDVINSLSAFVVHVVDPMPRRITRSLAGEMSYSLPPGPGGAPEESVWFGNGIQDMMPTRRTFLPSWAYEFQAEPPWQGALNLPTTLHVVAPGVGYIVLVGQMFCPGAIAGTLQEAGG